MCAPLTFLVFAFLAVRVANAQLERFQCAGNNVSAFTPQIRHKIEALHQQLRLQMANGQQANKCGLLPPAKNVYKMEYDCGLEETAYNALNCDGYGGGGYRSSTPIAQADAMVSFFDEFHRRWNTVIKYGVNESMYVIDQAIQWSEMSFNAVSRVGCGFAICPVDANERMPYEVQYQCLYQRYANKPNAPVYKASEEFGCKEDLDCDTIRHSKCLVDQGLCDFRPEYPAENGPNDICPAGSARLSDKARQFIVDRHNAYRASLIQGKEPMGTQGAFAPTGSRMYKLVYDCAIEAKAQEWADRVNNSLQHSPDEFRTIDGMQLGENLMSGNGAGSPLTPALEILAKAIDRWWSELARYGWAGSDNRTMSGESENRALVAGESMAWHTTYKVGCGISPANMVVCQYGPAGNVGNQKVYPEGTACTTDADCSASGLFQGGTCSASDGLCVHA